MLFGSISKYCEMRYYNTEVNGPRNALFYIQQWLHVLVPHLSAVVFNGRRGREAGPGGGREAGQTQLARHALN